MGEGRSRAASVRAGVAAGIAGFTVFLLIHHLWIVPIWFMAPIGGVLAAAGGAAVGASYADLLPHLPRRPWRAFAVMVVICLVLLPAVIVAELRGPIYAMAPDGGGTLLVTGGDAVVDIALGLIASAMIAGAGLGWLITRDLHAARSLAVAALVLALGPGHNIPILGGTPAVAKELVILGAVLGAAAVMLVETHAWLTRRPPEQDPSAIQSGDLDRRPAG